MWLCSRAIVCGPAPASQPHVINICGISANASNALLFKMPPAAQFLSDAMTSSDAVAVSGQRSEGARRQLLEMNNSCQATTGL